MVEQRILQTPLVPSWPALAMPILASVWMSLAGVVAVDATMLGLSVW